MSRRRLRLSSLPVAVLLVATACSNGGPAHDAHGVSSAGRSVANLAGHPGSPAAFTTFDRGRGGCLDSPNGINCNNYDAKDAVYMNGGPPNACLDDGAYFFAVTEPGDKSSALSDGAAGNLSQDGMAARSFTVSNCDISYAGPHVMGIAPDGHAIVQLMPYADTTNPGGVYQLVICEAGATSVSQCKSDNFHIRAAETPPDMGSGGGGGGGGGGAPDMAHTGPCT